MIDITLLSKVFPANRKLVSLAWPNVTNPPTSRMVGSPIHM